MRALRIAAVALAALTAASLVAAASKWPWQRRIGKRVEIQHKLQHERVRPEMWPAEPASPPTAEVDPERLTDALLALCGPMERARLGEYARAAQFARARLASVTATERIEEGTTSGTEDGFAWTLVVSPYDEREEIADIDRGKDYGLRVRLVKVESSVAWRAADGRDRNVRLATPLLQGKS